MTERALEWLSVYGLPVYFAIIAAASAGVPLMPAALTMLVIGSFVGQGDVELWQALLVGTTGAILGDQLGYFLGRFGGRNLIDRVTDRIGGKDKIRRAEEFSNRWGGIGVFFSRWLVTPLGPWINLASGISNYRWIRFTVLGSLGESLWVVLYVLLGVLFSDRVLATADLFVNLTWIFVGVAVATALGWALFKLRRDK